jgi:soluble lytic murein transglycosylase-like protein
VSGAFLVVLALGTLGWMLVRPGPAGTTAQWQAAAAGSSATPSQTPTIAPTTNPPTPTPSKTAKPTTTKKAKPTVAATVKPPTNQLPPQPKPTVTEDPSCEQHLPGADASPSEVSAALASAGAKEYWKKPGMYAPSPVIPVPTITVPTNLMKAIAWTESSWRSTIISCDKGIGLMQITVDPPKIDTAGWLNGRFETDYDVKTVSGNAALGAMYLEWLTMYFGAYYFGTFDLAATAAVGDNGATMRLRDVVISAYNVGNGDLENTHDTPDDTSDDTLHPIPNPTYVNRVIGYLTNCPCPA